MDTTKVGCTQVQNTLHLSHAHLELVQPAFYTQSLAHFKCWTPLKAYIHSSRRQSGWSGFGWTTLELILFIVIIMIFIHCYPYSTRCLDTHSCCDYSLMIFMTMKIVSRLACPLVVVWTSGCESWGEGEVSCETPKPNTWVSIADKLIIGAR